MNILAADRPLKVDARIAGFLYLLYLIATIFAGATRDKLIVPGDATATANNILASEGLFRLDFMSDVLSGLLFLLTAWALYVLLKRANQNLALLFLLLNAAGVAIQCLVLLFQFGALLLLSDSGYMQAFQPNQLRAMAMFFLILYRNGFVICQVFFGAWLLPLGYLVYKSGFIPRIFGILLLLDFVGEMIWVLQFFFFPGYEVITYPGFAAGFIAEVGLCLWLLIMGARESKAGPEQNPSLAPN